MSPALIVFDTETATCRGAPHLLEIGAIRIVDGDIAEHFEALVRPEVPIDDMAFSVHGISDADVRDARTANEVLEAFARFAGEDWLAAHNAMFDANVLGFEAARHALALPGGPLLDSLKLARRFIPEAEDHKLETLTRHLELDVDVHHRALADAVSCWKVIEECIARLNTARSAAAQVTEAQGSDALLETALEDVWGELLVRAGGRASLLSAGPKPPRLSPRLRALEAACRDRSRVTLLYGGEGALAQISVAPRILFEMGDKGYLEAECVRSGTIKTYRLDRVQKVLA